MSTPYVGLNKMTKTSLERDNNPWTESPPNLEEGNQDITRVLKETNDAKIRLISLLKRLGIETVQVGLFQMKLSEAVPSKHLVKATHYLAEQLKVEKPVSPYYKLLESCLCDMLCL